MFLSKPKARLILDTLLYTGGEFAELFMEKGRSLSIRFDNGKLDSISQGSSLGTGMRVLHAGRNYFGSDNSLAFNQLLRSAKELADTVVGAYNFYQSKDFKKKRINKLHSVDKDPGKVPLPKKIKIVRKAERIMRDYDSRIVQATVLYRESKRRVEIYNSHGKMEKEKRYQTVMVFQAVAADKEGMIQTGREVIGGAVGFELFDNKDWQKAAKNAARAAVLQLDAEAAPAGTFPVVLHSEAGGTMVHEAVGHGLEGDFISKGLSAYAGRLGEQVASPLISVIDDGTLVHKRGSEKMDDEGQKSKKNVLIKKGKLVAFLHDRKSARDLGFKRTGNGRRESFRHLPIPRMRNTYIAPGKEEPQKIIASVEDGLLVKKMGGGQVDIVNGNFVFNVSEAYRIRNGRVAEPVRGATLTGNGPKVMESIDMVGKDLGFGIGTCGKNGQGVPVSHAQPTLRIPSLTVGGIVRES
jgi:TldD protein